MWLLWTGLAHAAPVGEPIADPEVNRVSLAIRADTDAVPVADTACSGADACDGVWRGLGTTGVANLSLVRGLGVFAEFGHLTEHVDEASWSGRGHRVALGVHAALPVAGSWGVALTGRYGWSTNPGDIVGKDLLRTGEASLLGTWGRPTQELTLWAGAQTAWLWEQQLAPLADPTLDLSLKPYRPLSGVLGAAATSPTLGLPWRRGVRITVGAEGWVGQGNGGSAWIALGY